MPSPDESKDASASEPTELQAWLRAWIYDWTYLDEKARRDRDAEAEKLSKVIGDIAAQLNEKELPRGFSREDLASNYFGWLEANGKGKDGIKHKSGLKTDFLRFLNKECNKPREELVTLLSDALKELFKKRKVFRLDANGLDKRLPSAKWVLATLGAQPKPCDLRSFTDRARKIEVYKPPCTDKTDPRVPSAKRADGSYACFACPHKANSATPLPDDEPAHESTRKVISPKQSEELALRLLECADGWIFFCDLFDEFARHVHLFQTFGVDQDENDADDDGSGANDNLDRLALNNDPGGLNGDMAPEAAFMLPIIAEARAASMITALEKNERLSQILCCYVIPNRVRHEEVRLELFGDPRRVLEQVKRIFKLVEKHTPLNEDDDPDAEFVAPDKLEFVLLVFHYLEQWCADSAGKIWKCPLH